MGTAYPEATAAALARFSELLPAAMSQTFAAGPSRVAYRILTRATFRGLADEVAAAFSRAMPERRTDEDVLALTDVHDRVFSTMWNAYAEPWHDGLACVLAADRGPSAN